MNPRIVRWAMALAIVFGLIGHALADEPPGVVQVELERGGPPPWQQPGIDIWSSVFEKNALVRERAAPESVAGIVLDAKGRVAACLAGDPGFDPKLTIVSGRDRVAATLRARDPASGLALIEPARPLAARPAALAAMCDDGAAVASVPSRARAVQVTRHGTAFYAADPLAAGTPIVSGKGEVVGLVAETTFSCPLGAVRLAVGRLIAADVLPGMVRQLETRGEVLPGWVGAEARSLGFFEQIALLAHGRSAGLRVTSVAPSSPAEKAGLRAGDVIVGFGGAPCPTPRALERRAEAAGPGARERIDVLREGELCALEAELAELPTR
ncbi:MAG TPA: S1C family serine protease [Planctomycetota bacterium]|nr:S1C family serine protease [Planctomycetota bacterium]